MPLLGCIADDFTGATDLASMLVRNGMRTVQLIGVPGAEMPVPDADAIVVALKSRTAPVADAVSESLGALAWLRAAGCVQYLFKYCSTFDSTDEGNIGPVADALGEALGARLAIVCPAFPANKRTIYQGHLFVGDRLLSESGMKDHPLTPMRDPDLVRVLSRQTRGRVGLLPFPVVERGVEAVREALGALEAGGFRYAVADAITDEHLRSLGTALDGAVLLTGGSGIAMGLPENFRRAGTLASASDPGTLPAAPGHAAVLAGSCSVATLEQIEAAEASMPVLRLDPLATPDPEALARTALEWAAPRLGDAPLVIAASARPEQVAALQQRLGRNEAGALVENALGLIAQGLVARGVRRVVSAGGETSGAVVSALRVNSLRIGREIDPGVPWTFASAAGSDGLLLALKSGNFGGRDFFSKAFALLGARA
jgi:3-dehydrotetronate 4-kinase